MLPADFRRIAAPLGVKGVIKVEASPLLEDNQWVLDLAAKEPVIVGVVGNVEPGKPDFGRHLERFRRDKKFLGIRCGNLWGRNFAANSAKPEFMSDLKRKCQDWGHGNSTRLRALGGSSTVITRPETSIRELVLGQQNVVCTEPVS